MVVLYIALAFGVGFYLGWRLTRPILRPGERLIALTEDEIKMLGERGMWVGRRQ